MQSVTYETVKAKFYSQKSSNLSIAVLAYTFLHLFALIESFILVAMVCVDCLLHFAESEACASANALKFRSFCAKRE
jgi:hypothetical protein